MSIKLGDRIPDFNFTVMTPEGPKPRGSDTIFKGRKVVLFAVPGAFTPTCSLNHLPGFRDKAGDIISKGIDEIAVTSVNDVFVMDAWAKASDSKDKISFLADANGDFVKAIGLPLDLGGLGLGTRSQRYSMLIEDGIVKVLNIEPEAGKAEVSGAEALLKQI
jgi:peroxiredoxin